MIIQRSTRTSQPQGRAEIDPIWSSLGLVWASTATNAEGSGGIKNLSGGADGYNFDTNNPFLKVITRHGVALMSQHVTGPSVFKANNDFSVGLTEFTLVSWLIFNSDAPSRQWLNFRNTNNLSMDVFSQTASSLTWGADWKGSWNGSSTKTLSGLSDGQLVCIAASVNSSGGRLFHNGVFAGTKAGSSFTISTPMSGGLQLVNSNSLSSANNITLLGQAAFSKALPDSLVTALTANPWQISR